MPSSSKSSFYRNIRQQEEPTTRTRTRMSGRNLITSFYRQIQHALDSLYSVRQLMEEIQTIRDYIDDRINDVYVQDTKSGDILMIYMRPKLKKIQIQLQKLKKPADVRKLYQEVLSAKADVDMYFQLPQYSPIPPIYKSKSKSKSKPPSYKSKSGGSRRKSKKSKK